MGRGVEPAETSTFNGDISQRINQSSYQVDGYSTMPRQEIAIEA
jgi:hypothetical protein